MIESDREMVRSWYGDSSVLSITCFFARDYLRIPPPASNKTGESERVLLFYSMQKYRNYISLIRSTSLCGLTSDKPTSTILPMKGVKESRILASARCICALSSRLASVM